MKTINGTIQLRDLTLTDATYEIVNVIDNLKTKTCVIEAVFDTESIIKYSYTITGFSYTETRKDADIFAFVETELEKLKV